MTKLDQENRLARLFESAASKNNIGGLLEDQGSDRIKVTLKLSFGSFLTP